VCDGEQGDAGILSSLENLSLYVNAHSAGALIQQGIFRPDKQEIRVISKQHTLKKDPIVSLDEII